MKIYKTDDGLITQEALYWDFIRSIDVTDEYKLWESAIIKEKLHIRG